MQPPPAAELQLKRLRQTLHRVSECPMYRDRFVEAGITADDIRSLDDLKHLPSPSTRHAGQLPLWSLTVPMSSFLIHASSGTTGK